MTGSFLSLKNGYSLFLKHTLFGQPIEKCNVSNFRHLQENGFWTKFSTDGIAETHYFKLFQYPMKKFPGLSVIKASANGIEISDEYSYFLADFMTVDETIVVENANISEEETRLLAEEILRSFDYFEFAVVGKGQILAWFPGRYPAFEWRFPFQMIGLDYTNYLPGERTFRTLVRIVSNSWRILKDHPVNRVRLDLGENPANFLWFHSQNRRVERIEPLAEKIKRPTIFWPAVSTISDFARYLGFEIREGLPENPVDNAFFWTDIELQPEDTVCLIKKWESIDSELIPLIKKNSNKIVMEFNSGFCNNSRIVYLLHPGRNKGFLQRILKPKSIPAKFLFSDE